MSLQWALKQYFEWFSGHTIFKAIKYCVFWLAAAFLASLRSHLFTFGQIWNNFTFSQDVKLFVEKSTEGGFKIQQKFLLLRKDLLGRKPQNNNRLKNLNFVQETKNDQSFFVFKCTPLYFFSKARFSYFILVWRTLALCFTMLGLKLSSFMIPCSWEVR